MTELGKANPAARKKLQLVLTGFAEPAENGGVRNVDVQGAKTITKVGM